MNARRLVPLRAPRALALALALCLAPTAARADEASLKAEIAELRAQLAALQAQMKTFADRATMGAGMSRHAQEAAQRGPGHVATWPGT